MTINESYSALLKGMERYFLLDQVILNVGWDTRVMMPPKGIEQRSKQLALLRSLQHKELTNPEIGKQLERACSDSNFSGLSSQEQRNIAIIDRLYKRETRIPKEFVEKYYAQVSKTEHLWEQAKQESSYALFKPELEKIVELSKQRANYIDGTKEPFDVLMNSFFEPGMTLKKLETMFEELKKGLLPLIEKCLTSSQQPDASILSRKCPVKIQRKVSDDLAQLVGYDLESGRIDEAEHPFTSGAVQDVRITTHYYDDAVFQSFFAVLHEAGHGMYAQGISLDYAYQPIGDVFSYGMHESQSRFIENIIGRSREFWEYYLPRFKELTGVIFQDVDLNAMHHVVNRVTVSPIRVFADELTYALHIILRFEIERDLLNGKIDLADLPGVWNEKAKDYLKIDVENDAQGVLQDVHWSAGYFGYFPTYELGNIYSAQLLAAMAKDLPDYKAQITQGNLKGIKAWLDENVRVHGSLYEPEDLIEKVTGEPPRVKYLLDYLTRKYSNIYGF